MPRSLAIILNNVTILKNDDPPIADARASDELDSVIDPKNNSGPISP
jgi:hypothetical protein